MNIIVCGGTGFLGYYTIKAGLERGHSMASLAIRDIELGDWFPKEAEVREGDVFSMTEDELVEQFRGFDAMIYSIGPDDRITPPAPAYDFFFDKLVTKCSKVFRAARRAGVKRSVVYNSYFAYFDRIMPEKQLAKYNPYIGVRVQQAATLIEESENKMDVIVLELPYIFGSMPERVPIWKDVFLERFMKGPVVFFPKGGTAMIHVKGIGEAGIGAVERGEHGRRYPIGDENYTYHQMLEMMMEGLNIKKPIVDVNKHLCAMGAEAIGRADAKQGLQHGLDMKHLMLDIMSDELYIDADEIAATLGYSRGGVRKGIYESMAACYPDGFK